MLPLDVLTAYGLLTASIVTIWCRPTTRPHSGLADVWLIPWGAILKVTIPWSLLVFIVVLSLAILIGYVRFDPKLPPEVFLWAWINLVFTCIPEEALFRGFVQQGLQDRLLDSRHGELIALTAASVLFGIAHFAGGLHYIFLATVAGFGYGWIYQRTHAIESSILVHFMVNVLHFVFFTYPALK